MYVIRCDTNGNGGIVTKTLGDDNVWYLATNRAAKFRSVKAACLFFFSPAADSVSPVGSSIWVQGPRGGRHAIRRLAWQLSRSS